MYIRKSTRTYKDKTYTNHLLVESVQTAKGPRQRTICSLGSLEPAPAEDWLALGAQTPIGAGGRHKAWQVSARSDGKNRKFRPPDMVSLKPVRFLPLHDRAQPSNACAVG